MNIFKKPLNIINIQIQTNNTLNTVYFGFLINYPFNTLLVTGAFYIFLIPVSFVHFKTIKKRSSKETKSLISEDFI